MQEEASKKPAAPRPREFVRTLPRWKKVLIGVAATLLVVGLVLMLVESPAESPGGGTGGSGAVPSFDDTGKDGSKRDRETSDEGAVEPWSGGLFRLGFSFFAGFAVGYAARVFLKITTLAAGIELVLLFLLSYGEFITVNWDKFDSAFDSLFKSISAETGRFRAFITGSLPQAGLASLGLFTGFKKNA